MFQAIRKVLAGTAIVFGDSIETHPLEDPASAVGRQSSVVRPHLESELRERLTSAVRRQLVADVPVGVFLSGGLDSSLVASIASRESPGRLRTFSVRFAEPSYDEGHSARAVSEHLGSDHLEVMADPAALAQAFETIGARVAEPIADPAILPTWLLAAKAREQVGVVLSGEGADELFGGYPAYLGHKLARWLSWLRPLARVIPSSSKSVSPSFLLRRFLDSAHLPWEQRQVAWMGTGLAAAPSIDMQHSAFRNPQSAIGSAMELDYRTYLRDGLLPKVDRATMLVSLEARSPYLDRQVVDFAAGMPADLKVRGLTTKWILKRAARPLLPEAVIRRRKHGLSVPVATLMNTVLRQETDHLLAPDRLRRQGLLNAETASQLLQDLRGGNHYFARGIWAVLVLQKWMERWI
jgi:asparagine synthase (glutamine-hydrolysing)